jgi:excisionase family DNA binding protein
MTTGMLTIPEAAVELGLAPSTLRRQAAAGVLRADRLGRDWIVSRRELERYRVQHMGQVGPRASAGKPKAKLDEHLRAKHGATIEEGATLADLRTLHRVYHPKAAPEEGAA